MSNTADSSARFHRQGEPGKSASETHRFIFIGGQHRSGTWLQAHCLEEHPDISRLAHQAEGRGDRKLYVTEGQFLQSVYPDDNYYGGVGQLGFHPEVHLTESSALITEANRGRMFDEWGRYWQLERPFLLEKTPANMVRSRFLQAMFPNSYFIFVLRHPVAVALAQQKWTGTSVMSLIEHWLVCYEMLMDDIPHLHRYLFSRYEDFIARPDDGVKRIYDFLGLDEAPVRQRIRSNGNDKYFSVWNRAFNDDKGERTLPRRVIDKLMPYAMRYGYPITVLRKEVPAIIRRYEARVNRFGYSLEDLSVLDAMTIE